MLALGTMAGAPLDRAEALGLGDLKPLGYDCRAGMSVEDGTPFFEASFTAAASGGDHGGSGPTFDAGGGYSILTIADGKWLGVTWQKGGKTIAKSISVYNEGDASHRVSFVYNPLNDQEFAYLACSKQSAE